MLLPRSCMHYAYRCFTRPWWLFENFLNGGFPRHVQSQKRSDHAPSASEGQLRYRYGIPQSILRSSRGEICRCVGMAAGATAGSRGHHFPAGCISRWAIRETFEELLITVASMAWDEMVARFSGVFPLPIVHILEVGACRACGASAGGDWDCKFQTHRVDEHFEARRLAYQD